MHLLISHIRWECDGEHPNDCNLPENIIVLDAPEQALHDQEFLDALEYAITDRFEYLHNGYVCERATTDQYPMDKVCVMFAPIVEPIPE